jgi:hypothetical protein
MTFRGIHISLSPLLLTLRLCCFPPLPFTALFLPFFSSMSPAFPSFPSAFPATLPSAGIGTLKQVRHKAESRILVRGGGCNEAASLQERSGTFLSSRTLSNILWPILLEPSVEPSFALVPEPCLACPCHSSNYDQSTDFLSEPNRP